jgi:succinyl-CoA synthetase beta subunit
MEVKMKLHEYQAKELFRTFDIPVESGSFAPTADDALAVADQIGLPIVLKAQVHVGGRGKAGGIKVVNTREEILPKAKEILSLEIKGLPVNKLYVAKTMDIQTEVYLSLLLDRGVSKLVFIGCADGGVEIEETAKTNPEKILRHELTRKELMEFDKEKARTFVQQLFTEVKFQDEALEMMKNMGRLFIEKDASLVEINPLVITQDQKLIALDAKMLVDDNALMRHPDIEELRDMDSEDQDELDAKAAGLSFIRLDGSIGCMVNGAGLAMGTMDIIKHFGGEPANFLDVGGSSDPKKVVIAFRMILKDPKVNCLFINIFGGITRCDDIAKGILQALQEIDVKVPIVIRLVGTNEKEGRALLEGTNLIVATTLEGGAEQAVKLGKEAAA